MLWLHHSLWAEGVETAEEDLRVREAGFGGQVGAILNCFRSWRGHRRYRSSRAPSVVAVGHVHYLQRQAPLPFLRLDDDGLGCARLLAFDSRYRAGT